MKKEGVMVYFRDKGEGQGSKIKNNLIGTSNNEDSVIVDTFRDEHHWPIQYGLLQEIYRLQEKFNLTCIMHIVVPSNPSHQLPLSSKFEI